MTRGHPWPSRRRGRPRRCRARTPRGSSTGSRRACRAGRRTRAVPCDRARGRAPCARRAAPTPRPTPCATISRPSVGFCSNHSPSRSLTTFCTNDFASVLPSLVLVCPSNCGSPSLTDTIAVRPSRTSSPVRLVSLSLSTPQSRPNLLTSEVSAAAEALFVGAALDRVDRVGERVDRLVEAAVPLQRDLGRDLALGVLGLERDDGRVRGALARVEVLDEVGDAALVVPDVGALLGRRSASPSIGDDLVVDALVGHRDGQAAVEERHLLEAAREGRVVVLGGLEDLGVGPEA